MKSKKPTVSKVKTKAWNVFSKYIRLRDSSNKVMGFCYTCGKTYPIKKLQAGHFQPGRFPIYLFDERQVHAQCYNCNINLKGNWPRYYQRLKQTIQLFGLKQVFDTVNPRELRTMFGNCSQRSWYRFIADAKKVKLPTTVSPLGVIREHLTSFAPLNLVDFQCKMLNNVKYD